MLMPSIGWTSHGRNMTITYACWITWGCFLNQCCVELFQNKKAVYSKRKPHSYPDKEKEGPPNGSWEEKGGGGRRDYDKTRDLQYIE